MGDEERRSRSRPIRAQTTDEGSDDGSVSSRRGRRDRSRSRRRRRGSDSDSVYEVVFFDNQNGRRYIFPYENCKSWDDAKPLVEDVYVQLKDEKLLEEFRKGEYDTTNEDGDIIVPKAWASLVKPFTIFSLSFWSQGPSRARRRERIYNEEPLARRTTSRFDDELEDIKRDFSPPRRNVSFSRRYTRESQTYTTDAGDKVYVTNFRSVSPSVDSNEGAESDDSEMDTVSDTEVEGPKPLPIVEAVRAVVPALDKEGNKLTCTFDTKHIGMYPKPPFNAAKADAGARTGDDSEKTRNLNARSGDMNLESLRITKSTSAMAEGRSAIQVHILPGPEKNDPVEKGDVSVRWYHLHGKQLDFAQFRNTCTGVSGISDRLQYLTKKTLEKIEKDNIKAFMDGLFVEPGSVLRGDEGKQTDPQSVIFTCIPYFDIQHSMKTTPGDRLFPARTLMQTYYPYEPVRDRDDDQAYRQFGNDRTGGLIYVPNMWMMNIGPDVVVTCGYQPLTAEFVNSIELVREDLKQLGVSKFDQDTLTKIRLTDWDGRVLLYSLEECRSYFEMEQKLLELSYFVHGGTDSKSLQMAWRNPHGNKRVTPGNWTDIIKGTNMIFINLVTISPNLEENLHLDSEEMDAKILVDSLSKLKEVPPFFQWRQASTEKAAAKSGGFVPTDVKRSINCLDNAEKKMMSETLDRYDTTNAVDRTFTSTKYYEELPEDTVDNVKSAFMTMMKNLKKPDAGCSHHQFVVNKQCDLITNKASEFTAMVHVTIRLFVTDVNKSTMLRKVWGAMKNVLKIVEKVRERGALKSDPKEYSDENWKVPLGNRRGWTIRPVRTNDSVDEFVPYPEGSDALKQSLRKCKRCKHGRIYDSPEAAIEHLRRHLSTIDSQSSKSKEPNLKDWVRNAGQSKLEMNNAGALLILSSACEQARDLLKSTKELAEGVMNEDGKMSELYTFPYKLLEAFRRIMVYYLAVERSLHHTEELIDKELEQLSIEDVPYTDEGMEVLKRFGEGALQEIYAARSDLCSMVKSPPPWDPSKRLSLGPEYVCSWLMRRLLVKPLEKSMAVGDLYREYLSTIQFQVNHRPGKRMIRAINLLQEEIMILEQVNSWQIKLIDSYIRVLNDKTYEKDIPSRRAMFPYERLLLKSCLESLGTAREEYADQLQRCTPLSESAKQSAEINEEDHGKAIMVFTVVTVIFLPLSFVTSYLGMNTVDIRDMAQKQTLFWEIALPLTAFTMGSIMFIAYTFDEIRDRFSFIWGKLTGKQDPSLNARGISVAQRKRASKLSSDSASTIDFKSIADDAEYAIPRPDDTYMEDAIRSRLANFGFQDNQIQAMIHPDKGTERYHTSSATKAHKPEVVSMSLPEPEISKGTGPLLHNKVLYNKALETPGTRPTWVKINRKFLDADTLRYYDLPWEVDPDDPEYFLIKQELDRNEENILFEHSRRLRGVDSRPFDEEDEWYEDYKTRRGYAGYQSARPLPPPPPPPLPPQINIYNRMARWDEPQKPKPYTWVKQQHHHGRKNDRRSGRRARGDGAYVSTEYWPGHSGKRSAPGYAQRRYPTADLY